MEFIQIEVKERDDRGTAAMRKMRRAGSVPGVLYGLKRRNLPLTIPGDELDRFLRTGSHLVELRMGDQLRDAILREVQVDPISEQILHVDFFRVEKDAEVEDSVPITYKGRPRGVGEGGLFQGLLDQLRVKARPRDIPEEILLDISDLGVGDEIHVRDVEVPHGVEMIDGPDELVAHVVAVRGRELTPEEEEAEAEAAATPTEPEIIGKAGESEGEATTDAS